MGVVVQYYVVQLTYLYFVALGLTAGTERRFSNKPGAITNFVIAFNLRRKHEANS